MEQCKKIGKEILRAFIIFTIGSMIGCVVETMVGVFQNGFLEIRQGLVYGPFVPVYGLGAVVYFYGLSKIKGFAKIFFISMILGGLTEFLFSYLQEKFFGSVSWDYSSLIFNVEGRTSLLHCTYWGVFGIIFHRWAMPCFRRIGTYLERKEVTYATVALTMFMLINIGISTLAGIRNYERKQNIVANGAIDVFLDATYPQSLVDKLYAEKIKKE